MIRATSAKISNFQNPLLVGGGTSIRLQNDQKNPSQLDEVGHVFFQKKLFLGRGRVLGEPQELGRWTITLLNTFESV